MTTIAALVAATPAATRGQPVTIDTDEWRHVVEIADPGAGSAVAWHDITEWFCGYEYTRGADTYLGRYRASVATLEVCRGDDMLAPWNEDTSPLFGVHVPLGPGLLIRSGFIRVIGGVVTEWLPRFTNKVESWGDASWSAGKIRRHLIVARDTMTSLVALPLAATTEENWADRFAGIMILGGWPYGSALYGAQRTADDDPILLLPDRPATSSAINELDATLDPVGLVWYTNTRGQLVVRPRADDTFHADAFAAGATGTPWPGDGEPISYAWWACQADDDAVPAAYAVDNQTEPFGFDTTERAIINHVRITYPVGGFDDDDPISIQRYDRKTMLASWIAENDVVAAQILATRAYATVEARPLHSALGLERFYPEATAADYLMQTTIEHRNTDTGLTVSGNGWVRSLREQVAPRGCEVDWSITTIIDVYATESTAAMLPVEDLMLVDVSESDAEFSWSNPTQTIIPTNTQIRLAGTSSIWATTDYPITGVIWHGLAPATTYTFQVRLVRIVDGLIEAFAPLREITFVTDPATIPVIDPDGPTGVLVPPDTGCVLEWQLQSSTDDTTWTTVDSGTITTAPFEVDLSGYTFDPAKLYRLRQREVCASVPGPYTSSDLFVGHCSEPAILGTAPYNDDDLDAYWPGICPPDTVVEVITEAPALRGWAFDLFTTDGDGSVVLVADGDGPVAYGATPLAVSSLHNDTTIACRVQLAHQPAAPVVLFSAAGLYIDAIASGAVWKVRARCQEHGAGVTTITPALTLAFGTWYDVAVVHDEAAGDLTLYVDGGDVAHLLGIVTTRDNPDRFQIGVSNDGLITNCAVWGRVLAPSELPGYSVPPLTVTINKGASQADPTSTPPIVFDVVFSEAVSGFTAADVTISGTAGYGSVDLFTGGIITTASGYKYHEFRSTSTLVPIGGGAICDILAIGGGGGGGGFGGGGAGYHNSTTGVAITSSQSVTIGAAGSGAGSGSAQGGDGGTTSIGSLLTANGGGGGGGFSNTNQNGRNGGNGGGAGTAATTPFTGGTGGTGSPGHNGGNGVTGGTAAGGGAGNAGGGFGPGGSGSGTTGGGGGNGLVWSDLVTRAGGGGGGGATRGTGGTGGGAQGARGPSPGPPAAATNADAFTGSGGGGGYNNAGGNGASGLVIVRYPVTSAPVVTVTGSGATYTVKVEGMTSAGSVIASIPASVCTAIATSEPNQASTSTDNNVAWT